MVNRGWGKIQASAEYSGVSPRTFRSWLKAGLEHARLPSGTILIQYKAIDKFLQQYVQNHNDVDAIVDDALKEMDRSR